MYLDAIVLGLLAVSVMLLVSHVRVWRQENISRKRIVRSLTFAVRRHNSELPEYRELLKAS